MLRNVKWMMLGAFVATVTALFLMHCGPSDTALRGSLYSANLEECNRNAKTLCESVTCENHYRKAAGRMPRDMPKDCSNSGIGDAGKDSD